MNESVVLCEGFHDRAFWAGWLVHLGCEDPGTRRIAGAVQPIQDPWGRRVAGGQFAFYSAAKHFIRVQPCHGKSNIWPAAKLRLDERQVKNLRRLVINLAAVERLRADVGVPGRLRDLGVKEDQLAAFAERAFSIKRLMRVNPRPVTQPDLEAILRAAY